MRGVRPVADPWRHGSMPGRPGWWGLRLAILQGARGHRAPSTTRHGGGKGAPQAGYSYMNNNSAATNRRGEAHRGTKCGGGRGGRAQRRRRRVRPASPRAPPPQSTGQPGPSQDARWPVPLQCSHASVPWVNGFVCLCVWGVRRRPVRARACNPTPDALATARLAAAHAPAQPSNPRLAVADGAALASFGQGAKDFAADHHRARPAAPRARRRARATAAVARRRLLALKTWEGAAGRSMERGGHVPRASRTLGRRHARAK